MIKTVSTAKFTMDYCTFGQGDRAFVILPGLSVKSVLGSEDSMQRAYEQIAEHFTVYVFDRRKEMPPVYTVYDMARDTALAMEELGLCDADIFGASQGGMMGMVIAIEYPHLVHKLVLGSTSAHADSLAEQVGTEWGNLALAGDTVGLFMAFGEKLFNPETFAMLEDALRETAETVSEEDLQRFVIQLEGTRGFNVLDRLREIRCPVLVLGDETDAVLGVQATRDIIERLHAQPMRDINESQYAQPMEENLCGTDGDTTDGSQMKNEYYIYKDYGHAAYDTAPDYKERILQFLLRP